MAGRVGVIEERVILAVRRSDGPGVLVSAPRLLRPSSHFPPVAVTSTRTELHQRYEGSDVEGDDHSEGDLYGAPL